MKPFSLSLKFKPNKSSTSPPTAAAVNSFESIERKNPSKEFVTEFDSSKPPVLTILPKPNEWHPYKKMKKSINQSLQFEMDNGTHGSDSITYGLNIRQQELKEDLKKVGEENELEDYCDVPVEGFGGALLGVMDGKKGVELGKIEKVMLKLLN